MRVRTSVCVCLCESCWKREELAEGARGHEYGVCVCVCVFASVEERVAGGGGGGGPEYGVCVCLLLGKLLAGGVCGCLPVEPAGWA